MNSITPMAQALRDRTTQVTFTQHGGIAVESVQGDGIHIELSTLPPVVVLTESPPCMGHSKPLSPATLDRVQRAIRRFGLDTEPPLSLAPDFPKDRGRTWPWPHR